MDWISSIRSCVREAEWNRDEDLREQAQAQLSMIQHDVPPQPLAPTRVVPISIAIPQLSDNDRIAAMVRGSQMFKFGYSRGSLEQRLVQLSGDRSELIWGAKRRSRVLLEEVKGVRYGAGSLAFFTAASKQLFNFDWLCFSIITSMRSIDLCAKNFHEVVNFVMGMQVCALFYEAFLSISHVMLQQALLRQQPQSAAADASMSISCAQLEERLREMLGERKPPPPLSAPSPSSPVELRRMGRRISSANLEVSARGTHVPLCWWHHWHCAVLLRPMLSS